MANLKDLKVLGVAAMTNTLPKNLPSDFANISTETVSEAFRGELRKLGGDYNSYRRNKLDIFELMQEIFNEVLPKYVKDRYRFLADVRTVGHGQKITFTQKVGRARAKSFVTKVGLGGVFETFRLDRKELEISIEAIGGAAILDFERMLSGQEDLSEYLDILMEGIEENILTQLSEALNASVKATRPENTVVTTSSFDKAKFDNLITTVKAYGDPIIVCTPEFADTIPANSVTVGSTTRISDSDVEDIRTYGVLQIYKGCPIVTLPQSFTDETNSEKVLNPRFCYIIPGMSTKLATIVLEGGTQVDEFKNRDRSIELSAYQKVGVAILHYNNWAIYENTSLK